MSPHGLELLVAGDERVFLGRHRAESQPGAADDADDAHEGDVAGSFSAGES